MEIPVSFVSSSRAAAPTQGIVYGYLGLFGLQLVPVAHISVNTTEKLCSIISVTAYQVVASCHQIVLRLLFA